MNDKMAALRDRQRVEKLQARIEKLESLFPAILLYLEDQADVVDGDNGIPAPNRAMSLLVWTKHALEGGDASA